MRAIKKGVKSALRTGLRMLGHDLIPLASPLHRCTMEGAMLSGRRAAEQVLRLLPR